MIVHTNTFVICRALISYNLNYVIGAVDGQYNIENNDTLKFGILQQLTL